MYYLVTMYAIKGKAKNSYQTYGLFLLSKSCIKKQKNTHMVY